MEKVQRSTASPWWVLLLMALAIEARAQESSSTQEGHTHEVQAFFAPLLIEAKTVSATLPLGGARFSHRMGKGFLEYTGGMGAGHGVSYQILAVDYRAQTTFAGLLVFGTLGVHFDFYQVPDSASGSPARKIMVGNGFHFAGGLFIPINSVTSLRADFQQRFGPGRSLWVMVGPSFRF